MAIQFARIEIVSRKSGGNACCKGAYNARAIIKDEKTNIIYNFKNKEDNVYHKILLPEYADKKFLYVSEFMNEIEKCEKRKDSQLLKDIVLALPDDKELSLEDKIKITHLLIEKRGWVKEGLGVQVDIHSPHDGEKNWHAHLLVTTRRYTRDGLTFGAKAADLNPEFKKFGNKAYAIPEADQIHEELKDIINNYFKEKGLENRVDAISLNPHEHIGPVRMRSIFNEAARRNEERKESEIEHLNSGVRVLEKVTKHMSVFTRGDLSRAVKYIPDSEVRARLVEDAISDKSIIPLYVEEGSKTKYFTTKEIREEENKILRLSGYVANLENVIFGSSKIKQIANDLISNVRGDLTEEQYKALREVLLNNSGLRILRGRAGAGKSYVLGKANRIAKMSGVNVIGLAPTHKAKLGLAECGYERVDTVKGMLFKLANGRFSLPKHSLLVIDEAGMIGNDDYKELLRVAATRKCNVILAGDERQLASVQRGGMFEVFAGKYRSSTILDIQRQSGQWGKSVAMSMSEGRVESAISILRSENRIKWDENSHASMESLIKDWNKSEYNIGDRLILAVKNSDVAALNHGVRQYLKISGDLKGEEFAVAGNHYMQGDRVLITKTNKELGLINGDLAEITHASSDNFTIKLRGSTDTGSEEGEYREISFNPSEYSGFRHGYVTTVFKAQGASVKDVFLYHNGFAGIRNSYVALSRMVEELKLYVNKESTANVQSLVGQLSHDAEAGSSLAYLTESEVKYKELSKGLATDSRAYVRGINRFIDFVGSAATKLADKYIPSSEYYNYQEPKEHYESVEKVINQTYSEIENQNVLEEEVVVGGNSHNIAHGQEPGKAEFSQVGHDVLNSLLQKNTGSENGAISTMGSFNSWKSKESSKTRFYRNADRMKAIKHYAAQKEEWAREYEQLKSEVKFKAEYIARDLLGEPNKKLSNGRELRYGEHGKIIVCITGEKAGTWYDFSRSEGGDMFALVQEKQGCDFQQASDYLRSSVGMSTSSSIRAGLKLVNNHREKDKLEVIAKARREQEKQDKAKAVYVDKLYGRAKNIGDRSVVHRYLSKTRGINVDLGAYIKTAGIYDNENKIYSPALVAFAKDKDGRVTGGQQIILDRKTNSKADIFVPKKSFGKIAGSFVDLGELNNDKTGVEQSKDESYITIIAEGVETGLSVKEAMREHSGLDKERNQTTGKVKILCSLGISNIKNYQPNPGEKIIIAADNDGSNSNTIKTIESAKLALEEKGAFVEIVRPEKEGDFNDILQDKKNGGTREIAKAFNSAIVRHRATTLDEYFGKHELASKLDEVDRSNLELIQEHNLSEKQIVDAYRKGDIYGKIELDKTRKGFEIEQSKLDIAKDFAADNKELLDEAKKFGYNTDYLETARSLVGMDEQEAKKACLEIRDRHFSEHLDNRIDENLKAFAIDKSLAKTSKEVMSIITKEQNYLSEMHDNIKSPEYHREEVYQATLEAKENIEKNVTDGLEKALIANQKQGIKNDAELVGVLKNPEYKVSEIYENLHNMAKNERHKVLQWYSHEVTSLQKMDSKIDYDKLVNTLSQMSTEDSKAYINALTAVETKKYVEPLLASHAEEKTKATNTAELMSAIAKEQATYVHLNNDHGMAIYALDKSNGNMNLSLMASAANDVHKLGGINYVQKIIDHAIDHNIRTEEKLFDDLKNSKGNLKILAEDLHRECTSYHRNQVEGHLKDLEKKQDVFIGNHRFSDKSEYLNHLKQHHNHDYMPTGVIDKHLQHIHDHHLEVSKQAEKEHEQENQKQLHLNKNIGGPSL